MDHERGDLEGEESLDFLEEMDAIGNAADLGARAGHPNGSAERRALFARLAGPRLARLIAMHNRSAMVDSHFVAVAKLLDSGRGESLRDDELIEMGRMASAPAKVDVLAGTLAIDAVDALAAYGALPRVSLLVPTGDRGAREIVVAKPGANIALIGGTGAGKTSLALEIARCHARWTGPVAFFGLELSIEESAARLVGQGELMRWMDAAELPRERLAAALDIPRMHIFGRMSVDDMRVRLRAMKERYGTDPVLAVVDYAQILQDAMTERLAFAGIIESVRKLFKEELVVGILTSQSSRAGATALKTGEKIGAETLDTGAESAQLERAAYVTLALGEQGDDDGHGWRTVDLNVGKSRMGAGDLVLPVRYHGASGRFEVVGDGEQAKAVRVRRAAEREAADVRKAQERDETRVRDFLLEQDEPVSRSRVQHEAGGRKDANAAALARMIRSGEVVEVGVGRKPGWHPPVVHVTKRSGLTSTSPQHPHEHPQSVGMFRPSTSPPWPFRGQGDDGLNPSTGDLPKKSGDDEVGDVEWSPSAEHQAYAAKHGLDLPALVATLPVVRDRDAALMAAMLRARTSPDAMAGSQRGFLGFGPSKPRGKP